MGLDFDQLFPNRFLKAGEFQGRDVTMTIKSIEREELEGQKGKEVKAIISFTERPKQWVVNKTNAHCLKAMFGRDTGAWVGKRVTLYPATITVDDEETLAIRVRGSPDIAADITFTLKLARKKPRQVPLKRTGAAGKKAAPTPPHNAQTGEVQETPPADNDWQPTEPPEDVELPTP